MKKWKKCPLLIVTAISMLLVSGVALAGTKGAYKEYNKDWPKVPAVAGMMQASKEGILPWDKAEPEEDLESVYADKEEPATEEATEAVADTEAEADKTYTFTDVTQDYFDDAVFIGDSRTEGLRDAVNDDSIWSCLSSMGYDWMVSTGVPQVEDQIEDNTAVIILMGVNDLYHVNDYISYINSKAAEWGNRGAQTYFVSVGPVQNDPYCSNAEIESFNAAMQANLSGVTYIDVYSHLVSEGFSTVDGTHYPDSVSVDIYNYILDHLEEQRSGIWG